MPFSASTPLRTPPSDTPKPRLIDQSKVDAVSFLPLTAKARCTWAQCLFLPNFRPPLVSRGTMSEISPGSLWLDDLGFYRLAQLLNIWGDWRLGKKEKLVTTPSYPRTPRRTRDGCGCHGFV
ncbi:hypothetical protein CGMCC3_g4986 [Colletotrichum fructicola]|nr:uncharacterized protein CGMCC3_g4986 [Colletotrichum fructicola]KAE9578894.1 hypothetical protein CGMCC3_g4986 [Colletotrichum fructicola]